MMIIPMIINLLTFTFMKKINLVVVLIIHIQIIQLVIVTIVAVIL